MGRHLSTGGHRHFMLEVKKAFSAGCNRRFNDVPLNSTKSFFIKPLGCNSLSGRPSYGS